MVKSLFQISYYSFFIFVFFNIPNLVLAWAPGYEDYERPERTERTERPIFTKKFSTRETHKPLFVHQTTSMSQNECRIKLLNSLLSDLTKLDLTLSEQDIVSVKTWNTQFSHFTPYFNEVVFRKEVESSYSVSGTVVIKISAELEDPETIGDGEIHWKCTYNPSISSIQLSIEPKLEKIK